MTFECKIENCEYHEIKNITFQVWTYTMFFESLISAALLIACEIEIFNDIMAFQSNDFKRCKKW